MIKRLLVVFPALSLLFLVSAAAIAQSRQSAQSNSGNNIVDAPCFLWYKLGHGTEHTQPQEEA